MNTTCHHLLLIPDPDPSLNCWGGNPYCLVLFRGFKSNWNVDMTQQSARPPNHKQLVPCWPFCTGKQKAYAKCTALPTKYNSTHLKHLKCFPNFIAVEGHTDWITVTILMCKLRVSVTSCTGHIDLNVNQKPQLYKEPKC